MDFDKIRELLKLMEDHGLAEAEVESGDGKVRLRKAETGANVRSELAPPREAGAPSGEGAGARGEDDGGHQITSPIVGTLYRSPSPDSEPFVEAGDPVTPDTVVCIIEAMKVMNEVKAEVSGSIRKVLVQNGTPVEYGQPLFLVSR